MAMSPMVDRKSTRLNSSHSQISYAVFCLKKKTQDRVSEASMRDIVNQNNLSSNARSFSNEVERVANAMMNAQVAIYPVDCSVVAQNSRAHAASTMRVLAERTGGKTYINRNDVDMGVRTSMDDGTTYYTLE